MINFVQTQGRTPDLYVESGVWSKVAAKDMLSNPGSTLPPEIKWDPKRLIVQHMDGRNLRYPYNTFDGIFSNSSIEHFGGLDDVAQSAREMGRVLKPGGTLNIATEYKIKGPDAIGFPGAIIFDKHMLEEYIIKPSGLFLADDIDDHISDTTLSLAYPLEEAVNKGLRIPSVALLHAGFTYTSISLTLLKKR
jgi:SAM-dependent methyltransferase